VGVVLLAATPPDPDPAVPTLLPPLEFKAAAATFPSGPIPEPALGEIGSGECGEWVVWCTGVVEWVSVGLSERLEEAATWKPCP